MAVFHALLILKAIGVQPLDQYSWWWAVPLWLANLLFVCIRDYNSLTTCDKRYVRRGE